MRLKNKIALVTGSTAGIGAAIARTFAREGARVMVHGRRETEAIKLVDELGGNAAYHIADLQHAPACGALIAATVARFGGLDILVNNAAVSERSNLETTDAETFDRIIAINLRAPLLLTRAALPHFRKAGGGCVLNIGSVNAYCGEPNLLAYSVSKGGLMTLTRNLADALGRERIRVNQFNVGWVLTENEYALKIKDGSPKDWPQKVPAAFAPSGRLQSPDDIAYFALTFCADEAALISGAVVELEQYPVIGRNPLK